MVSNLGARGTECLAGKLLGSGPGPFAASRQAVDVTRRVILLSPSSGLGGGIERYVETLEWAFATQGIQYRRIDLRNPGPAGQTQMMIDVRALLRESAVATRLVVAHLAMLPATSVLARDRSVRGISVLCHGCDVWGSEFRPRRIIERRLLRGRNVRVTVVSSFTAGAIARVSQATVLPPGLSGPWFHTLVDCAAACQKERRGVKIVTAFRLAAWQEKGLPELMGAVATLDRPDIQLTVCGTGEPPADLKEAVKSHAWCSLRHGLTDRELAAEFASADLFVLASRTRTGRHASGEGFGLVLLEAQVAGTPVVGPAHGGSHDAYLDRVTGFAPHDESAAALAMVLDDLLRKPERLEQMGRRAADWARESFAPERYAELVVSRLL